MEMCRGRLSMYGCAVFRVCVQGALDEHWSDYFGTQSISVETDEDGVAATRFVTEAVDQAALVGLINRLNGLGLPLLGIECLSLDEATQP